MMKQLPHLLCLMAMTAAFFALTTPVLAGPTATPSPTPVTPTPATPTPVPDSCAAETDVSTIITNGKGQSPSNNAVIRHAITGHIYPEAESYSSTAHRIRICAGTSVTAVVTDTSRRGMTTNAGTEGLTCTDSAPVGGCTGVINSKQQYKSTTTASGSDKDTIVFLPVE